MSDRTRNWFRRRKRQRVTTGLGYLYNVLRKLSAVRLTRWLMRKPWHVADELKGDGTWVPVMAHPKRRPLSKVAKALNEQAAARAAQLAKDPQAAPQWPKKLSMAKLASVRLKPGMKLWQLIDGQVCEVIMKETYTTYGKQPNGVKALVVKRKAGIDPRAPIVAALNRENASRKLGVTP